MIPSRQRDQNALDHQQSMALATQTVRPTGSTQSLDHRREVKRLERWRAAADPILLWPVIAALTQLIL